MTLRDSCVPLLCLRVAQLTGRWSCHPFSTCSMHTVHCILHTEHCTLHTAPTLHTACCTLHKTQCTLHTVHCTLNTAHCTLHTTHCTLNTAHCTLHTAHCTQHILSLQNSLHSDTAHYKQLTLRTEHSTQHTVCRIHFTLYILHLPVKYYRTTPTWLSLPSTDWSPNLNWFPGQKSIWWLSWKYWGRDKSVSDIKVFYTT